VKNNQDEKNAKTGIEEPTSRISYPNPHKTNVIRNGI
jgi:hypothetical protein